MASCADDAQGGVEGLLVGDEDFLLHGVLPERRLLGGGGPEGGHLRDEHDDEVEVGIGLILRVIFGRELVDMLLQAGDVLFEEMAARELVLGVGIVDIGGHGDLGVDDDVALVVEVQQHVGSQVLALVGTDGVAVLVAHHDLCFEVFAFGEALLLQEVAEDDLAPVALGLALVLEGARQLLGAPLGLDALAYHVLHVGLDFGAHGGLHGRVLGHLLLHFVDGLLEGFYYAVDVLGAGIGEFLLALLEHGVGGVLHLLAEGGDGVGETFFQRLGVAAVTAVLLVDELLVALLEFVHHGIVALEHLLLVVGQAAVGLLLGCKEGLRRIGLLCLQLSVEECGLGGVALTGGGELRLEALFLGSEGILAPASNKYPGEDARAEGYDCDNDGCCHLAVYV